MSVYFIGDLHLGHKNILKFRNNLALDTVEEHDEMVVDCVLSTLSKRDKIVLLGDICFTHESLPKLRRITDYVESCTLILGNHDLENNARPTILEYYSIFGKNIHSMLKYKDVWLTHAPLHPEELRGRYNVHGHVHENSLSDYRYFNASCEPLDYVPIEYTKLMERISYRKEWYEKTHGVYHG